jgi:hypothetical protein
MIPFNKKTMVYMVFDMTWPALSISPYFAEFCAAQVKEQKRFSRGRAWQIMPATPSATFLCLVS